jgi:hypothetical protein
MASLHFDAYTRHYSNDSHIGIVRSTQQQEMLDRGERYIVPNRNLNLSRRLNKIEVYYIVA